MRHNTVRHVLPPFAHGRLKRLAGLLMAAALSLAVAACGGGDGASTTLPPPADSGGGTGGGVGGAVGAPTISAQPESITVAAGAAASFSVAVSGSDVTYQWLRDGTAIAGANAATYTIAASSVSDSGSMYAVNVKNAQGEVSSTSAVLTVTAAAATASNDKLAISPFSGSMAPFGYNDSRLNFGSLKIVNFLNTASPVTVNLPNEWIDVATLKTADVDVALGTTKNLRAKHRVYFKSEQLFKIDLAKDSPSQPVRLSTLQYADICAGDGAVVFGDIIEDWIDPNQSLLVYEAKPRCGGNLEYRYERQFVAVKAGMGPADIPISLGAYRPLTALRDPSGSINGYLLFNGLELIRSDKNFENRSLVLAVSGTASEDVTVAGAFGPPGNPGILLNYYARDNYADSFQLLAYRPSSAGAPVRITDALGVPLINRNLSPLLASDSGGTYLVLNNYDSAPVSLLKLNDDFSTLSLVNNLTEVDQIVLTPSRFVLISGNVLTSELRSGGGRERLEDVDGIAGVAYAIDEDIFFNTATGTGMSSDGTGGVKILRSDLSGLVSIPEAVIVAPSFAENQILVPRSFATRLNSSILIAEKRYDTFYTFAAGTLSRYVSGRGRSVLGTLPNTFGVLMQVPDIDNNVVNPFASRVFFSAFQDGQSGLLLSGSGSIALLPGSGGGPVKLSD